MALHRPASQLIPLLRKQADLFGREIRGMAVVRWRIHFEPLNQGWTGRQRFPTSPETAGAEWSGWVDDVVANFGMGHVCAAVKLSIYYDPAPMPVPTVT